MLAIFRENLPYKIAALIFAILLHIYVAGQQSPTRVMTVPLILRNLPPGLLLGEDMPRQVMLTLSGPADEVDRAGLGDITASLDLSHSHSGKTLIAPVVINAPDDLHVEATPDTVTLSLMPRETRHMAVTAAVPIAALPGYRYETPRITPHTVTVSGRQDAVDSVTRLVVKTDAPTTVGTVNGNFDIVALDAHGSQVQNVMLTPAYTTVVIHMVRVPAVKTVPVSPNITGPLPVGIQVNGIEITPRLVLISGSTSRLAQIASVSTAPVDISNAVSDVTRTINCIPPPGVTLTGASAVTVIVHIGPPPTPGQVPAAIPNPVISSPTVVPNGQATITTP
jgi:YbbR domain-containing protein